MEEHELAVLAGEIEERVVDLLRHFIVLEMNPAEDMDEYAIGVGGAFIHAVLLNVVAYSIANGSVAPKKALPTATKSTTALDNFFGDMQLAQLNAKLLAQIKRFQPSIFSQLRKSR